MTDRAFLGEFEQMVLAAVLRLAEHAYGAAILTEIEDRTGRRVSSGSLYVTLDRMEQKGLIETWRDDPTPERGGRPRRYVRVTRSGLEALRDVRQALLNLWRGIEDRLETAES
ncbi:MAG TPA: PadR family transcriptional regulator [Thermoanaerobaculia bacterium]|nr:PadR family transcriptional regulator [Thermoanaerobaculia bacterium]